MGLTLDQSLTGQTHRLWAIISPGFFAAKLDLGQRFCDMRAHKSLFNNLLRGAMKSKLTSNKADADPIAAESLLSHGNKEQPQGLPQLWHPGQYCKLSPPSYLVMSPENTMLVAPKCHWLNWLSCHKFCGWAGIPVPLKALPGHTRWLV